MDALSHLKEEFEKRKKTRKAYSLRAYARDLGISVSHLSMVLSGQRRLSLKQAVKAAAQLKLSPHLRKQFLTSALEGFLPLKEEAQTEEERILKDDEFALIGNWYHFAILSLAKIPDCRHRPEWLARRLGLDPTEALIAVGRLLKMGLVTKKGSRLVRTEKPLRTTHQIPSPVRREFHRQMFQVASSRLDSVPLEKREVTSVTMAIDPNRVPMLKQWMKEFKNKVSAESERGEPSEVYTLSLQLFPLTV